MGEDLDFNSAAALAKFLADGEQSTPSVDQESAQIAPLPNKIGVYRIHRLIAVGGMAEVYEAIGTSGEHVALKVVRQFAHGSPIVRRLQREADLLQLLDHPCIARVHEAGDAQIDGQGQVVPFIAMDLVQQSKPIDTYVKDTECSVRDRIHLMYRVSDAIHHAHRRGVIHRDLKPGNILVSHSGDPVIVDFGIGANASNADATMNTIQTLPGQLLGTLQYMSPEQVSGEPASVDLRTDIYSLGLILYKLVTGVTPYSTAGTPLVIATQIVRSAQIPQPKTNGRRVDRDLEAILVKCLAKSASLRYQTAEELRVDLGRWLKGRRVSARSSRRWIGFTQWLGRHPIAATTSACAAMVLVSVGTAVVAVQVVNSYPHSLYVNRSSTSAQIRSLSGRVLFEWTGLASMGGNNKTAVMVRASDGVSSERFVVLCMGGGSIRDSSNLRIVSFQNPSVDLWTGPGTTSIEEFPDYLEREISEETGLPDKRVEFFGRKLAVADVFPEIPGEELITIEPNRRHFPTAIRVYSLAPLLSGEAPQVLYECWHPGHLGSVYWHEESRSLVAVGKNNRLDYSKVSEAHENWRHPAVIFAVQPAIDQIEGNLERPRWITEYGSGAPRGPIWYEVLTPTKQGQLWEFSGIFENLTDQVDGQTLVAKMKYTGSETEDASTFVHWVFNPHTGSTRLGPIDDSTRAKKWIELPGQVRTDGSIVDWAMTPVEGPCYREVDPLPTNSEVNAD